MRRSVATVMFAAALTAAGTIVLPAQRGGPMTDETRAERWRVENELASLAIIERKVMIPMRDGVRIAADIYRPKDTSKKYPRSGCARRTTSTSGTSPTACRAT